MSRVYIVKDGIIVDTLIATESYRSPLGETVKPKTLREELTLILTSEVNEKIKAAEERIARLKEEQVRLFDLAEESIGSVEQVFDELSAAEHEKYVPGQVMGLKEEWRKASAMLSGEPEVYVTEAARVLRRGHALQREIQQQEMAFLADQITALNRIGTMRVDLGVLESMMFDMNTTEGAEKIEAEVNLRTGGRMEQIKATLEQIESRIDHSPEQLRVDMKLLDEYEQEIKQLPQKARDVFTAQAWRQEQIQNVVDRLESGSWELVKFNDGDGLFDDSCLLVKDALDHRAVISFTIEGEVRIDSFFEEDAFQTRTKLQQLVVGALKDGGAEKAAGKCMDREAEPSCIQMCTTVEQQTDDLGEPVRSMVQRETAAGTERRHGQG